MPTLRPKLRNSPRMSFWMAIALSCKSLRAVRSAQRFWLVSVLTWTGRNRLTRIIWAMPRASMRSDLFGCASRKALVWRVSMQITGRPASARPLISHCDSGPASRPIRSKVQAGSESTRTRSSGWLSTFLSRQILPVSSTMQLRSLFRRHPILHNVSCCASPYDACGCGHADHV